MSRLAGWLNSSQFKSCFFFFSSLSWTRQELNRLRKAALAFGFWELLKGVAELLERECTLLPDSAHPDAAFQLSHAAQQLKLASTGDSQYAAYDHNIIPMHTDFSSWVTEHGPGSGTCSCWRWWFEAINTDLDSVLYCLLTEDKVLFV